jgi:hypothetical protein
MLPNPMIPRLQRQTYKATDCGTILMVVALIASSMCDIQTAYASCLERKLVIQGRITQKPLNDPCSGCDVTIRLDQEAGVLKTDKLGRYRHESHYKARPCRDTIGFFGSAGAFFYELLHSRVTVLGLEKLPLTIKIQLPIWPGNEITLERDNYVNFYDKESATVQIIADFAVEK